MISALLSCFWIFYTRCYVFLDIIVSLTILIMWHKNFSTVIYEYVDVLIDSAFFSVLNSWCNVAHFLTFIVKHCMYKRTECM